MRALRKNHVIILLPLLFSASVFAANGKSDESALDTAKIEQLTGLQGKLSTGEGAFKVSYPRKDLSVQSNGVTITPPLGLTAWTSFKRAGDKVAVMGDLVLTQEQVNPVMSVALDNDLEVTALHNHFFNESPRIMFMHIGGLGEEDEVASAVGKVFAELKRTAQAKPEVPQTPIDPTKSSIDTKKLDQAFGASGELSNGVYKFTIGRKTKVHGHDMGNTMGVNTWAAFAGSDDRAVVDGDFAMKEEELQNVLKTLRHGGIDIVAIHNHMTMEKPRILFLHFWGIGRATDLAQTIKAALDTQDLKKHF